MTAYLLGELSEAEQADLEREFFSDARVFDELLEAETTLVDDYAGRRLSKEQRLRFEEHYMRDARRAERARFAQALRTAARGYRPTPEGAGGAAAAGIVWWRRLDFALAGGLAVAIGLAVAQTVHVELVRRDAGRATADAVRALEQQVSAQRQRINQLSSELSRVPSSSPVVSLLLTASLTRQPDARTVATVAVPAGTEEVRVQVAIGEVDFATYRIAIQPAGGSAVSVTRHVKPTITPAGSILVVPVAAEILPDGDYVLSLSGETARGDADELSRLLFRVSRK